MRSTTAQISLLFAALTLAFAPFALAANRPFIQTDQTLNESALKRPGTLTCKTMTSFVLSPTVPANLSGLSEASEIQISNTTDMMLCIEVKLRTSATVPTCSLADICGSSTIFKIAPSGSMSLPIPYLDSVQGFGIVCGNLAAAATNGEFVTTMARNQ